VSPFKTLACHETFQRPITPRMQAELESFHPGRTRFANNGYLVILPRAE
jgi:hypothetical protein